MMLLLTGCNTLSKNCPPNTIIEWVDMVKINDIRYQHDSLEVPEELEIKTGKKLGEVSYEMADDACTNHKMKNGDAAFLGKGTPIYEVEGYLSSFMVYAGNKVYMVDENKSAETVNELYPIEGKVKNIIFQSTYDGALIHTFSKDSKEAFLREWLSLKLFDPMKISSEKLSDHERVFIGIELDNGIIFRETYYTDKNVFHFGAKGTKQLQQVVKQELQMAEKKK
ncbi:hypothetical protein J7E38_11820 [Bacillus sp. ISL-35]|nr:hypothetical protein [Bacillus sp. ISL-35]MBT2679691.1 hypothetical protein [Bacillus sp. ISL-35]